MNFPISNIRYKTLFVETAGTIPHTHFHTCEIIQTFDNYGSILINGTIYNMEKNGLYFINGVQTHFTSPDDINKYNHSIVILNNDEINNIVRSLKIDDIYAKLFVESGGAFCALSESDVIKVDNIILQMRNLLESKSNLKYAKLSSYLTELFEIGFNSISKTVDSNSIINSALSYINNNITTEITIDDICNSISISKFHLCRLFKKNMGVTIGEFITTKRLSIAKQLLTEGSLSVAEVAKKSGFTYQSFFSKLFKREFGITPMEYKAENNS